MDFNAYVFLIPMVLLSLPGAFFPVWHHWGDTLRLTGGLVYSLVLYLAFAGKMLFYKHFHDIFNQTLKLGAKAEKHNLVDIFFHQDHGAWILLGILPYLGVCGFCIHKLLQLPSFQYLIFFSPVLQYAYNTVIVPGLCMAFLPVPVRGLFWHDDKPEWDTIPSVVKKDIFFAMATVDDLVALEQVMKHKLNPAYEHTDAQDLKAIQPFLTEKVPGGTNCSTWPMDSGGRPRGPGSPNPPIFSFLWEKPISSSSLIPSSPV